PTVAYVADEMELVGLSQETARLVTHKLAMRQRCQEFGLAGPKFYGVESKKAALAAAHELKFPLVVKPQDSFGSRGVSVVMPGQDDSILSSAIDAAFEASFTKRIIVEEFMEGQECSVEV